MFEKITNIVSSLGVSSLGRKQKYYLNDPKKQLVVKVIPPSGVRPAYRITGQNRSDDAGAQAKNMNITIGKTIGYMQTVASDVNVKFDNWAGTPVLNVKPRAGKNFNAFYNRASMQFFYAPHPITKKMIYAADSTDVVAHELGHALLDSLRRGFWGMPSLEIWSFHETFADVTAMLHLLSFDEVLHAMVKETNGDLRNPNLVSNLAEEMGEAIYLLAGKDSGRSPHFLRNVTRQFKYVNPQKLPKEGPSNKLIAECHSFGRVFASAWYEIMVRIYEESQKQGLDPVRSLKKARNYSAKCFIGAAAQAPRTPKFLDAAARAMLNCDKQCGSHWGHIMQSVFDEWHMFIPKVKYLSTDIKWTNVKNELKPVDNVIKHEDSLYVQINRSETKRISDLLPKDSVSMLSVGQFDLSNLSIEIPNDTYYEFNNNGDLVDEITPDENEIVEDVKLCLATIQKSDMWAIRNDKLERIYIS